MNNMNQENFYDIYPAEYNKRFPKHSHPDHVEFFLDNLPSNATVIDLACAGAREVDSIRNRYSSKPFRPVGLDLSFGQLKYARETYVGLNLVQANMLEIPFPNNFFDGIWCYAGLDHLDLTNFNAALTEMLRILKPGGIFSLATRNGRGILETADVFSNFMPRKFTCIPIDKLSSMLRKVGFQKIILPWVEEIFDSATRKGMQFSRSICSKPVI